MNQHFIPRSTSLALILPLAAALAACGEDDTPIDPGPGTGPGTLTPVRSAALSADGAGGAPDATGTVSIARDASGALFVVLGPDFAQEMGPGDTQIILARSDDNVQAQRDADPSAVSPAVGTIDNGFSGAATFPVPASVDPSQFSHLIIWCPTAGVNFGAADLDGGGGGPAEVTVRSSSLVADGSGGAPDATGTVRVIRTDGGLALELGEDFAQEMGPGDTQLILARTGDSVQAQRDADPSSASPSLGTIPNGASGARRFDLPSGVDLDSFDYVIVWCPTAGVNFGAAELPKRSGTLVGDGAGGAPDATGGVSFARGQDGALTLELGTDFMQEMGPGDTQIFLARGPGSITDQRTASAEDVSMVVGTVTNGATGPMSFAVPGGVAVDQFDHLIVWCPTAGVNFGVASLD